MSAKGKLYFVTFLTLVRFPLVIGFFAGAIVYTRHEALWLFVLTFGLLILSAITDLCDGYFARRFEVETAFGEHVDPLMDKFYYVTTFPVLVFVATLDGNWIHAVGLLVLTLSFLARDQWVTFLRAIGSIYNVSGGASWLGKLRTCINFPLICTAYYFEEAPEAGQFLAPWFIVLFEAVAFAVNGLSLLTYTMRYWPYLRRSASER